jgi:hypothetical protein
MKRILCVAGGVLVMAGMTAQAVMAQKLEALPLRVHVYTTRERVLSRAGKPVAVEGMGQANLYEHGEPRGFDFRFTCPGKVPTSEGYGTYPARWKEKGRTLEVFVMARGGKPGAGMRCEMKVDGKDGAYYRRDEKVQLEPAATFKEWMQKHQYDPEHGKNEPTR